MKTFTLFIVLWCVPLFIYTQEHGHQIKADVAIARQPQQGPTGGDYQDPGLMDPNFGTPVKSSILVPQGDKIDPWYNHPVKSAYLNPEERKRPTTINPRYSRPAKFTKVHESDGFDFRIRPGTLIADPGNQGMPGIEGYDPWYHRPVKSAYLNPEERKRPTTINPRYSRPAKFTKEHERDGFDFRIRPGTLIADPGNQGMPGIDGYDPWYHRPVKSAYLNPEERKRPTTINPRYSRPAKFTKVHERDGFDFRIRPGMLIADPGSQGMPGIEGYDPWFNRPVKSAYLNPEERKRPTPINPRYSRPSKWTQVHESDGFDFRISPGVMIADPGSQGINGIDKIDPHTIKSMAMEQPHGDKTSPKGVNPYYNRPVKVAFLNPERGGRLYNLKPGVMVSRIDREPVAAQESETGYGNHVDYDPYTHKKAPESFFAPERDRDIVSIVDLGTSANVLTYGEQNGAATYTWYNEDLHALTNVHRMGGEAGPPGQYSGDLCYDVSFDGGNTWSNQIKIYESNISGGQYNIDAARFPQAAIYNPEGNEDPEQAYLAFFAANLDGSNGGDWGGYSFGVGNLVDAEDTTKHIQTSDLPNGYYQGIPSGFAITRQDNIAIMPDASLLDSHTEYLGDFIFMRGEFNTGLGDYEYEKFLVPVEAEYARYLKVAFDPSGQIGYVFWCNENGSIPEMEGWQYPLIIKSEDAGESWSDAISIQLGGPNGIETITNWLSDEMIEQLWEPPVPARDEIMYSTPWWNTDIAVDAWGNPHLACAVHIAGPGLEPGFVVTTPESYGVFDIYSIDEDNEEWYAVHLGTLNADHAEFANPEGDPLEDFNRLEVASTWNGTKLFFSWLDTRLDGVEENTSPDIYARGFDLEENTLTNDESSTAVAGANCVTAFSEAMWQAYFKSMTPYVIRSGDIGNMTYTLPLFYVDMNPLNILDPVQFKYIQDFSYTDGDFSVPSGNPPITMTGLNENVDDNVAFEVSQNYPNPFNRQSTVMVTLESQSNLIFRIYNQVGQVVYSEMIENADTGTVRFKIDASSWRAGVYFYTVSDGLRTVTKKMIVQ